MQKHIFFAYNKKKSYLCIPMISYILLFVAALAPVAVLLWYIYRQDSLQPEPISWLIRAVLCGVASAMVALTFTSCLKLLTGWSFNPDAQSSILGAFANAFVWAAIPEETAKLLMLWLLLRWNPYFDENMDGIVYAACVGLGFAGIENILYLYQALQSGTLISVGISRAIFSVPGHFLFGVAMGYFYSIYHFGLSRRLSTRIMIWLAPVLAHGIFDGILFSMRINEYIAAVGLIIFLVFFRHIRRIGRSRIEEMRTKLR